MLLNAIAAGRALGLDTAAPEWAEAASGELFGALGPVLDDIERAARTRAVERYPLGTDERHDGGTDRCPPAAVRHVLSGALVASLASWCGFRYGSPPAATDGDIGRLPERARGEHYGEDYPRAPHYAMAEELCELALGVSTSRDPEGPSNERTPDELHARVIDLASDVLCSSEQVAEIAAGFAAWLLATYRGAWATARARRLCSAVGVRFPRV